MKIKKLDWDSDFFNLNVGEISVENNSGEDKLSTFDVIYVKQNQPEEISFAGFEKKFQETKVIFTKKISVNKPSTAENTINDFDDMPIEKQALYELAFVSGNFSRFLLDENFGVEKFKKLYRIWIDNSINKKFADKIFYTNAGDQISGFVTLQKKDELATIGLIAVDPKMQGKGIGKNLLLECEKYCNINNISELRIPTQEENTNACKFYGKMGYSVLEKMIIKHYWII